MSHASSANYVMTFNKIIDISFDFSVDSQRFSYLCFYKIHGETRVLRSHVTRGKQKSRILYLKMMDRE